MGDADPSMGPDPRPVRAGLPSWTRFGVREMLQQGRNRQCLQCTSSRNDKSAVHLLRHQGWLAASSLAAEHRLGYESSTLHVVSSYSSKQGRLVE